MKYKVNMVSAEMHKKGRAHAIEVVDSQNYVISTHKTLAEAKKEAARLNRVKVVKI